MSDRDRGRRPDVSSMHSVMVSNLPSDVRTDDLYRMFERYGEIGDVHIPRRGGRPSSYGFVRFYRQEDAEYALRADGKELLRRRINVQTAKFGKGEGPKARDDDRRRDRYDDRRDRDRGGYRRDDDRSYRGRDSDRDRGRESDRDRDRDRRRDQDESPRPITRRSRSASRSRSPRGQSRSRTPSPSPPPPRDDKAAAHSDDVSEVKDYPPNEE